jgi:hypothetical protein
MGQKEGRPVKRTEDGDGSLFELGEVMVSPPAKMHLRQQNFILKGLLDVHQVGEWRADAARELANDMAIASGRGRVVSVWQVGARRVQITTKFFVARETLVTLLPIK